MKRRRGSVGLALSAMLVTLMLFGFCLSSSLHHYQLSNGIAQRARARDEAESMIHLAIAELCRNPGWTGTLERRYQDGLWEVRGYLSFQRALAHAEHIPYSTNNLAGAGATAGDGQRVPRAGCHLAALGHCGSQKIQIETVLVKPPYPTGCAAQGPVELRSVQLWGLPAEQRASSPPRPEPWAPANVFTNRTGPGALRLDSRTSIFGNALAAGGIDLESGASVRGEVVSGARPRPIANFDIPAMWNQVSAYVGVVPYYPGRPLDNFCIMDHDLSIAGDLEMRGGTLAVRGNLSVSGKISGRGLILVTGNVEARSGTNLEADQRLALLCGGDLRLEGAGSEYYFSGLVYARGHVVARDLTILGALIADGPTGNETVLLDRVNLINSSIGVRGNVGRPYNTGTEARSGSVVGVPRQASGRQGEPMIMNLQSYVDESGIRRYSGTVEVNESDLTGADRWPPQEAADRGYRLVFSPPQAYLYYLRGSYNGLWTAAPSRTVAFDGSRSQLRTLTADWLDNGHSTPFHNTGNALNNLDQYLNLLDQGSNQNIIFALDLNNLLPQLELTRLLTWREGSPSR